MFGLIIGYGLYAKFPPGYTAATSVLLTNNPNADSTEQADTNVALAQSQGVAQSALQQLGLAPERRQLHRFVHSHRLLGPGGPLPVSAPSTGEAVRRASALTAAFLQVRAHYLQTQQQLQVTLAQQQLAQAQQKYGSINQQVSRLSAQPITPDQQAELRGLQAQLNTAGTALNAAQQNVSTVDSGTATTASMVKGSQILNSATATPHSFKQGGFSTWCWRSSPASRSVWPSSSSGRSCPTACVAATTSRTPSAHPVTFSTGQVGTELAATRRRHAERRRVVDVKRLVAHLNGTSCRRPLRRFADLAVVAVDNAPEVAPAVVSLAETWAREGKQVVLADLSDGSPRHGGLVSSARGCIRSALMA